MRSPISSAVVFVFVLLLGAAFASACESATETVREIATGTPESQVVTTTPPESQVVTTTPRAETSVVVATKTPRPPTPTPTPKSVSIAGFGFTQDEDTVSYGVLIKNDSATDAASDISLNISFYDSAGAVLKVENGTISLILPSQFGAVGNSAFLESGQTVARMDVQARPDEWGAWGTGPVPELTTSNLGIVPQRYGGPNVTGIASNPLTKDLKNLRCDALFVDASNKIIGGALTYVDFVGAQGQAPFEIHSLANVPAANVAVWCQVSYLTLMDLQD